MIVAGRIQVPRIDPVERSQPKGLEEGQLAPAQLELGDQRLRDSEGPSSAESR